MDERRTAPRLQQRRAHRLHEGKQRLARVIAGGSGTLGGPAVGAALVLLLKNYVSAYLERWNMLLGFVFLFIVLVMPTGIVAGVSKLTARMRGGPR